MGSGSQQLFCIFVCLFQKRLKLLISYDICCTVCAGGGILYVAPPVWTPIKRGSPHPKSRTYSLNKTKYFCLVRDHSQQIHRQTMTACCSVLLSSSVTSPLLNPACCATKYGGHIDKIFHRFSDTRQNRWKNFCQLPSNNRTNQLMEVNQIRVAENIEPTRNNWGNQHIQ